MLTMRRRTLNKRTSVRFGLIVMFNNTNSCSTPTTCKNAKCPVLNFFIARFPGLIWPGARPGNGRSGVHGQELFAVNLFLVGQVLAQCFFFDGAVLEAAFDEDRHVQAGDCFDALARDFAFQGV